MSLYTENAEKWKSLASIDYFTQFIKAWIPFNAWYKNFYPTIDTDRRAIDEIKANRNSFRNRLISLLEDQDNAGFTFKSRIAELHLQLERKYIYNKNERITFEKIKIEENTRLSYDFLRNNLKYEAIRGIPHRRGQIDIFIYNRDSTVKFSYTQTDGFDLDNLINNSNFQLLSPNQQNNLKACYEEINPSKTISLLSNDINNCIQMGNLHFINDRDKLCKGIIEIIYKLRNVLFHGEIIPDSDTNKVYEPAYQILHTLIQSL
ncbi:hypothetical protein [Pseudanabaena sp. 'Roaring Creek']|uniref:hypothetical protein n=1 Tax=Pseudanabaena sp. 'Roaring Creek' TaxID=1681830 RepID=UPI0006D82E3F|nr:hypothetical protein [Pseudanabaena sp. 'Roaring Creek']